MKHDSEYINSVNNYSVNKVVEFTKHIQFFNRLAQLTDLTKDNNQTFAFIIFDRDLNNYFLFQDEEQLLDSDFSNCDIFYGLNNDKSEIMGILDDCCVIYQPEQFVDIETFMSATFGYIAN